MVVPLIDQEEGAGHTALHCTGSHKVCGWSKSRIIGTRPLAFHVREEIFRKEKTSLVEYTLVSEDIR